MRTHRRRSSSTSKTYFFDATNGSDTNSGQPAAPKQTIAHFNTMSTLKPGDRVLFARGQSWAEHMVIPASGSPNKPIYIGAYGTGTNPTITSDDAHDTIDCEKNFISIANFIVHENAGGSDDCIRIAACHDVMVEGCDVDGGEYYGIIANGNAYNIRISNNTAHDGASYAGIGVQNSGGYPGVRNVVIENNTVDDWGSVATQNHGIYCRNVEKVQIRRNVSNNNYADGITLANCTDILVDSNICDGNGQGGLSIQDFDLTGGVQKCVISNNLISNSVVSEIYISAGNTNIEMYHNTIYAIKVGVYMRAGVSGCVIKNNLLHAGTVGDTCLRFMSTEDLANNTVDYNLYERLAYSGNPCDINGTSYSLVNWRALGTNDEHSMDADPVFVTNYTDLHIQTTSPAKNAGANLGLASDLDGNARSATPCIGAYEYI